MAIWPTSVATDADLYLAVNELQTTLASGATSGATTLTLVSTTNFPAVGLVLIDTEVIKYAAVSGNTLTGCTRGFDGTSAASHLAAATVSLVVCAAHHNVLKDEVKAIEQYLSDNFGAAASPLTASRALATNGSGKVVASAATSTELGYLAGVTSAIQTQIGSLQTQINTKAPTASPTFSGTIGTPLTVSKAVVTDSSGNLAAGGASAAEVAFLAGVTSNVQDQIDAFGGIVGEVKMFAGASTPSGWHLCDGTAISRTTYAALFAALSTTWGPGDGSTTFNVPDLRGRTPIGAGTGSGLTARTLGTQNIGEETHVLTTPELAAHSHGVTDPTHSHVQQTYTSGAGSDQCSPSAVGTSGGTTQDAVRPAGTHSAATGVTVDSAGGGGAHNNMQPSAVVNFIIKL